MDHFVITGTGRSGTRYMADALNSIGISTGHEECFHRWAHNYWRDYAGDSSWFVLPWLEMGISKDWPLVNIVRDPTKVIASKFETGLSDWLDTPILEKWWPEIVPRPEDDDEDASASDRFERYCALYCRLMDISLEFADATYQIETLDYHVWRQILAIIGYGEKEWLDPIWSLPRDTHHKEEWHRPRWKVPGGVFPWRILPAEVQRKALMLGYEKTAGDADVINMILDRRVF